MDMILKTTDLCKNFKGQMAVNNVLVLCQEKVQIKYALLMLSYPAKASALSSNAA